MPLNGQQSSNVILHVTNGFCLSPPGFLMLVIMCLFECPYVLLVVCIRRGCMHEKPKRLLYSKQLPVVNTNPSCLLPCLLCCHFYVSCMQSNPPPSNANHLFCTSSPIFFIIILLVHMLVYFIEFY